MPQTPPEKISPHSRNRLSRVIRSAFFVKAFRITYACMRSCEVSEGGIMREARPPKRTSNLGEKIHEHNSIKKVKTEYIFTTPSRTNVLPFFSFFQTLPHFGIARRAASPTKRQ